MLHIPHFPGYHRCKGHYRIGKRFLRPGMAGKSKFAGRVQTQYNGIHRQGISGAAPSLRRDIRQETYRLLASIRTRHPTIRLAAWLSIPHKRLAIRPLRERETRHSQLLLSRKNTTPQIMPPHYIGLCRRGVFLTIVIFLFIGLLLQFFYICNKQTT